MGGNHPQPIFYQCSPGLIQRIKEESGLARTRKQRKNRREVLAKKARALSEGLGKWVNFAYRLASWGKNTFKIRGGVQERLIRRLGSGRTWKESEPYWEQAYAGSKRFPHRGGTQKLEGNGRVTGDTCSGGGQKRCRAWVGNPRRADSAQNEPSDDRTGQVNRPKGRIDELR